MTMMLKVQGAALLWSVTHQSRGVKGVDFPMDVDFQRLTCVPKAKSKSVRLAFEASCLKVLCLTLSP